MRSSHITRKTQETTIDLMVTIDGSGDFQGSSGIAFFDHMLSQLARHGGFDITLSAAGDLEIDSHHTVEDVGITLGQALKQALGDKAGITRFGHAYVPMDEALTRAAIDISGRAFLVWRVDFTIDRLGAQMETELFREFFHAFAAHAGITMHIENLYAENNHHRIESVFKAVGRALSMACALSPAQKGKIPSTKGML